MNQVVLNGFLEKPGVESKSGGNWTMYKFQIRHNKRKKQQDGQWGSEPHWIEIKTFNHNAGQLQPGMLVYVVGELQQERWEAQDGSKRSKCIVFASEVGIAGRQPKQDQNQQRQNDAQHYQPPFNGQGSAPQPAHAGNGASDIPF